MTTYNAFFLEILNQLTAYLPRLGAGLLVLIIGATVAKWLRKLLVSFLKNSKANSLVKNTPVEHFLKNAELQQVENVVGSVVYWLLMIIILHTVVSILGLSSLTVVLERVIEYIPRVISAVLILFFGVLVAGVTESLVKGAIKSIDGRSSRLLGKLTSYIMIILFVLAAISELGIAREFILILFIGLVSMLTIGFGLAFGLGGQDLVKKLLQEWYSQFSNEIKE